jgi:hypothetical protein
MTLRHSIACLVALPLAACMSTADTSPSPPASAMATAVRVTALQAMAARVEEFGPTTTMPTAGVAAYHGYGEGEVVRHVTGSTTSLIFDVTLEVDFASASMSGLFDNFATVHGPAAGGAVELTGGTIADGSFAGSATGTFGLDGTVFSADGDASGTFLGPDAQAARGDLTLHLDGGTGTVGAVFLSE